MTQKLSVFLAVQVLPTYVPIAVMLSTSVAVYVQIRRSIDVLVQFEVSKFNCLLLKIRVNTCKFSGASNVGSGTLTGYAPASAGTFC